MFLYYFGTSRCFIHNKIILFDKQYEIFLIFCQIKNTSSLSMKLAASNINVKDTRAPVECFCMSIE